MCCKLIPFQSARALMAAFAIPAAPGFISAAALPANVNAPGRAAVRSLLEAACCERIGRGLSEAASKAGSLC